MLGDRTLTMRESDLEIAESLSLQSARPPALVSGYTPERLLGNGAYGEVWVAIDQNTSRRVAIKFYAHRGGLDWSLLSREVEKLSFLFNDRYIVQLLEVGWQSDPPYYVMEYLERGSLEQFLNANELSVPEALSIFKEIAQGLANSHGKGVLHCDLKPANVLLDDEGRPRLADFGQSRLVKEQSPSLGTLFYMAPEQADLNATPDARWDVYALGAILYRMLTGSAPYQSEWILETIHSSRDLGEQLKKYREHLRNSPHPRKHRKIPGVDRWLTDIVERCLAIDPKHRFANPQMVLDALHGRDAARARQPLLLLGGVGPVLLLIVVALFAWSGFHTTITSTTEALAERTNLGNHFAARFVAETVARQIDRRWTILEKEATDNFLREQLREPDSPEHRAAIQKWLDERREEYQDVAEAASWFVTNSIGLQLARSPLSDETVGQNFAWRDYFHGLGSDLPKDSRGLSPIQNPHLSPVFESTSTRTRMVAFSVPIWSGRVGTTDRKVLGVLAMTVEVGKFGEIQDDDPKDGAAEADKHAVLLDTRADNSGQRGLILQHPALRKFQVANPGKSLPLLRYPEDLIDSLADTHSTGVSTRAVPEETLIDNFQDPVGGEYAGNWLGAFEPVIVEGRPKEIANTGWMVVVQERVEAAARPVLALEKRLATRGILALILVLVVISLLWALVILAINGTSRSKLSKRWRRRAGLTSQSSRSSSSPAQPLASTVAQRTDEPRDEHG
ncbi:MAG: serine/threonine protein kinase [Planctomycetota bacterium]